MQGEIEDVEQEEQEEKVVAAGPSRPRHQEEEESDDDVSMATTIQSAGIMRPRCVPTSTKMSASQSLLTGIWATNVWVLGTTLCLCDRQTSSGLFNLCVSIAVLSTQV